jgi:hypothetical protein
MKRLVILVALGLMLSPSVLFAAETELKLTAAPHAGEHAADSHANLQPVLSKDTTWAGVMVIVIIAMFVAATAVGLVVRFNAPQEVPPTHSHDEPPGTSGHHGASGTVDHHSHQH